MDLKCGLVVVLGLFMSCAEISSWFWQGWSQGTIKAIFLGLMCVLLYQCKIFNEHAREAYGCKCVGQIDDLI